MFKALIAASLVLGFGSVAFANEPAPAPSHEETTTKKTVETKEKKAHGDHADAKKPHGH